MTSQFKRNRVRHSLSTALAMPKYFMLSPALFDFRKARSWFALILALAALGLALAYVVMINFILVDGEAIKRGQIELKYVKSAYAVLSDSAVKQQSPSWLEEHSRAIGMVEVVNPLFIEKEQSVALSR